MIAAAASAPSAPTPNVATAGPGSRSLGAGRPWMKIALPSRSHSAKNPSNRGSCSDMPLMLDAISTPASAGLGDLGQLGRGHVRVLHRDSAEAVEARRVRGDQAGDVLVGDLGQVAASLGGGAVVQQRGERGEQLRVQAAGRGRLEALLRVEPHRFRGKPHRPVHQEPGAVDVRVRLGRRPGRGVAAVRRRPEVAREDVRVRVDDRHGASLQIPTDPYRPGMIATWMPSSPGTSPASSLMACSTSSRPYRCVCIRSSGNLPDSISVIASV